jgi:WhiB family redox-sensing transcriptional regulator
MVLTAERKYGSSRVLVSGARRSSDYDSGGINANWRVDAACVGVDDAVMFLESGKGRKSNAAVAAAQAVCASCPVLRQCQSFVMEMESGFELKDRFGMWAGLMPNERHELDPVKPTKLRREYCKNGHKRTEENTQQRGNGTIQCRTCAEKSGGRCR